MKAALINANISKTASERNQMTGNTYMTSNIYGGQVSLEN